MITQPTSKLRTFITFVLIVRALHGETLNFNPDWRFEKSDPPGAQAIAFDDRDWKSVSTPHTFNDTDTFDDWSPAGHKGEMNQWMGRTWYRKHFVAPEDWQNKTVIIEFEAVRQLAEVYVNGVKIGSSINGFLPFAFDLSPHLKFGRENVLAVMVDNSFIKDDDYEGWHSWDKYEGGAKLPWNNPHWHPAHGGIYRNVRLHVKEPLHLTLPLYSNLGTVGTYVYAREISRAEAMIGIEPQIQNSGTSTRTFKVRSRVLNRDGATVLTLEKEVRLEPSETRIIQLSGRVRHPQLWEPQYPYLYSVDTELIEQNRVVDSDQQPLGIRWFHFDKDYGFFINDRYVKLQGWGQKSTNEWPGLGAAQPDWLHDFTLKMIRDAGGNFIRWGHTAGSPAQLKASDKYGILTLQPGVDGEKDVTGSPWEVRLASFRDVIIYYRNHPSIAIWEGGNQSVTDEHATALRAVMDQYDPHGGRAYAHRRANAVVEPYCDITISTEGSGFRPALPTVEGEYNREESPRRVWDRQTPPYLNWHASGSYDLSSEEFAINQLFQYEKIASPKHCGGANWIFSDSTSGGRVDSEVARTSGEVDAVRLPKEAYWVCKVIFTDEPDLHLIGHWNYPTGTVKDVHVVADCDEVELFLNGRSLGRLPAQTQVSEQSVLHPLLFTFPKVQYEPGELLAIGYVKGKEVARMLKRTHGPATALRITPITGPGGFLATGSDVALFDVEAVDAAGNRCLTWEGRVDFELSGPGIWRGGYNSGRIDSINHTWLNLECGINRVAVRSTLEPGTIELIARSKGLQDAAQKLEVNAFGIQNGMSRQLPVLPPQEALTPLPEPPSLEQQRAEADTANRQPSSAMFDQISYSGPTNNVAVVKVRPNGQMYSDHHQVFATIPDEWKGGECLLLPNADWNYSAVDLLQFESKQNATLYILHDTRLPKESWLEAGFERTGKQYAIGQHHWDVYQRKVSKGESVLIGSNTEDSGPKRWMMVLISVAD